MIRDTSQEAYDYIVEQEILSGITSTVYKNLYHYGPMTMNNMARMMKTKVNYLSKAFDDLRSREVVSELEQRHVDEITGRKDIQFDVTSKFPKVPKKRLKNEEKTFRSLLFAASLCTKPHSSSRLQNLVWKAS